MLSKISKHQSLYHKLVSCGNKQNNIMATWTNLYINTDDAKAVCEKLKDLTDNLELIYDADFPSDMGDFQLLNTDLAPNYIAVGQTGANWITVVHNSFDKMVDWGKLLSKHFSCKVIVTIAQSVSSYYYFALYDKGEKLREIEACYSDDTEGVNFGNKFDFENDQPGQKHVWEGEESYLFDFDAIEEYCSHFNLTIQTNYSNIKWTLLKGQNLKKEVAEYIQKHLVKKPWWKFW